MRLPPWAAQVLCHRGLADPDQARAFLAPQLADLPAPAGLAGLTEALKVLVPAVVEGRTIGVAGDYDADGVTATALMVDFLRQCGAPVVWDLPQRQRDGYGFSPAAARRLAAAGAQVIVTVDCGISDHAGVAEARALGMAVVVSDHHQVPPGPLPPAAAVINPHLGGGALSAHLAGVGVAFYLAAGLRAGLREAGHFGERPLPNLRQALDLVAIGTMADVSPLLEENRVLVTEGLKVVSEGRRTGLKALCQAARLGGALDARTLDARDLAFGLAPRLNAAGRLESPDQALELLLCEDPAQAAQLAKGLDRLNQARREVEAEIFAEALEIISTDPAQQRARCLVLAAEGWHRGVLGIVASRIMERTGRPAVLLGIEQGPDGPEAVGSGRSLPGFHLHQALCGLAHLLTHFGGHSLAAGMTLPAAAVAQLAQGLAAAAGAQLPPPGQGQPLELEAEAGLGEVLATAPEVFTRLAPFGPGHPEPLLAVTGLNVHSSKLVGETHLKLDLRQNGSRGQAIGFRLAHLLPRAQGRVDLACIPRMSTYGGRHLELVLEDLRPAEKPAGPGQS
jgi:single-stranded-DNA-specific exonuclease